MPIFTVDFLFVEPFQENSPNPICVFATFSRSLTKGAKSLGIGCFLPGSFILLRVIVFDNLRLNKHYDTGKTLSKSLKTPRTLSFILNYKKGRGVKNG